MSALQPSPDAREQILDAATRLFAERGFDGTPIQAIADAVGLRKPSLLYHFGSKEELRESVLDRLLSRWNEVLPRLLLVAAAGEEIFEAVVREVLAFFAGDPDRARLLLRELLDRPAAMRARLLRDARPWLDVLAKSLRKGQQQGLVHGDVDREAYVLEITLLLLAGVATDDTLRACLAREGAPIEPGRTLQELTRIARTSLFRRQEESA